MEISPEASEDLLTFIWLNRSTQQRVKCRQCGLTIQPEETLARTFTLQQLDNPNYHLTDTVRVTIPVLSRALWIYSRHLECLFGAARYVTISHVWHPDVTELAAGNGNHDAQTILKVSTHVALGLEGHIPADTEIWLDYISVPQWQPTDKEKILQAIPQIFGGSEFTVAYLSDVDQGTVWSMRRGVWLSDRVCGISAMCSTRWFSRVWTATELVVSKKLRAMLQDFTLLEETNPNSNFVEEIFAAWSAEARRLGDARHLEAIAGIGDNLVPWQLGPLELVRDMRRGGQRAPFGVAHELLARRCVTSPRDYLRAFVMISISDLTEPELSMDTREALLQIANNCIEKNDYTPLFMTPGLSRAQDTPLANNLRLEGYMDTQSFGIGHLIKSAPAGNVRIQGGVPVFRMENLGRIRAVETFEWNHPAKHVFAQMVELVLRFTGPDVGAFADTLAVRLYAQSRAGLLDHLSASGRASALKRALEAFPREADAGAREHIADAIAGLLRLSDGTSVSSPMIRGVSPMGFMETHGRRIHLGSSAAVVAAECPRCLQWFLLRVGTVRPLAEVMDATAYRVPGLQYRFSHEGGMGVLVRYGGVVARFVWGAPTCECLKLEEVSVHLDLPFPQPNEFRYGLRPQGGGVV